MSYYDVMKNAKLYRMSESDVDTYIYHLKLQPDSNMRSTVLIFAMERIIITGDWCPGGKGVISDIGYGLAWFAGICDPRYLASKFLRREWIPASFRKWVVDVILEADTEDQRLWKLEGESFQDTEQAAWERFLKYANQGELFEVPDRLANVSFCVKGISNTWESVGLYDALTDGIGYDYNPDDLQLLSDIQRRFAEEYQKQQ